VFDMLVKLYTLPALESVLAKQTEAGVDVRRAQALEKRLVAEWVCQHFSARWASECEVAFSGHPISCFVAVADGKLAGFACYDATCKGFFGPIGVDEAYRGRGIGKALLLICLHAMAVRGYGYAIIGAAGPTEFYAKTVGASEIEGSAPGVYRGMLRE